MAKKILLLILMSVGMLQVYAQHPPPELINATIINDAGHVKLSWVRKDTTNENLQIRKGVLDNINDYILIHTISSDDSSWIDQNSGANNKPKAYRLNIAVDEGTEWEDKESNVFNTTHLKLHFDTCAKTINLTWSRYVESPPESLEWKDFNDTIQIKHYKIWKKTKDNDFKQIHTTKDTSYHDNNIEYNRGYKYYVEAVREKDTSIKSKSNRDSIFIQMPQKPDFIKTKEIGYDGDGNITLQYEVAENSELENYALLRSNDPNGAYDTAGTITTNDNILNYTDTVSEQQEEVYFYHVAAMNQCNIAATRSDTLSNIVLNIENNDLTNELQWNSIDNKENVTYTIFRKIGSSYFDQISTTNRNSYYDTELENLLGRDYSAEFCYYIEAEVKNQGNKAASMSKEKCLHVEPELFIPNTFTPNNDGKNDEFRPVFSFLPEHYHLIIYNRAGEKVFESKNPEETWRGEIKGSGKAPAGTYIYYLEAKNPENKLIKKRGRINVFYP
ncbi:MAG: gliding motility-associated C-terminal domain-containing protein [Bacteroidales bacterium]